VNVTVPYSHARSLHDLAWRFDPVLELTIWRALEGHTRTVTFNLTYDNYRCLVQVIQNRPTLLSREWAAELLRTLNEYALPILVEEALAVPS